MFLNKLRYASCALALVCASSSWAAPRSVALLLGDVDSRPAVLAVNALDAELRAAQISVRIIPANSMNAADRAALRSADAVVLNVIARQVVQTIEPELRTLRQGQRPVIGVGAVVDEATREMGVRDDRGAQAYYRAGGVENLSNLLRHVLHDYLGVAAKPAAVRAMPDVGLFDVASQRTTSKVADYVAGYSKHKPGAPWIGVMFYRASLVSGQTLPLAAIVERLEKAGYNVMPVFGYPYDVPLRYFLDEAGKSRVELIVALGMKVGSTGATGAVLDQIGVPALNAITLSQQSVEQWKASKVGLDIIERTWQLAGAELAGLIQPTVVASRERVTDAKTGLVYVEEQPIAERVERLAQRVQAWMALRQVS